MHRIDTPTAQKDKFGAGKNGFARGNPQTGTPSTDLDDDYFDSLQEEIVGVIEAAAITLDKSDRGQLLRAMKKHFQTSDKTLTALAGLPTGANKLPYFTGEETAGQTDLTQVGRDIIGKATAAAVLEYLGLGAGAPPIGIPFFWPSAAMPNTIMPEWQNMVFLKLNDASFSATTYPKQAMVWPGLVLTESRGEFIRVWDDGRGVDPGRELLSYQGDAIRNITGNLRGGSYKKDSISAGDSGVFTATPSRTIAGLYDAGSGNGYTYIDHNFNAGAVVPTASENRSRSISFNF
ncbi:hypothetical protein NMD96_06425 [Edwardsiella tarda]